MGKKKYYCDYCDRYFNDDKNTITKHLKSIGHLNLKREHHNLFRDPETLLIEEFAKKPCRKFHMEGYCSFGGSCNFSHYSKDELEIIRQDVYERRRTLEIPTVDEWLFHYNQNVGAQILESRKLLWSNELPPELSINSHLLPPSMLPFHIQNFIYAELETWG